jgi:hypothetical protein
VNSTLSVHETPHFLAKFRKKKEKKKKVANLMIFGGKNRKFWKRKLENLPDFNTWIIFSFIFLIAKSAYG